MPLKISELAKVTGVPQSTIRYYVKEGLLPKPAKVNKSMSYYDESCIDRINFVKELQDKKYYPLSVIRNIIKQIEEGTDLQEVLSLEDAIFRPKNDGTRDLFTRKEFLQASGLTEKLLREAESLNIVIPYNRDAEKPYNHEDLQFARNILLGCRDLGIAIKDMTFYVDLGEKIVLEEIRLRKKIVVGKTKDDNLKITALLSERADELRGYIIRRLFQSKVREMREKQ